MTSDKRLPKDLYALFDDLCDGSISEADAARLDQLLHDDPDARWEYLCYMDVHAGLGLARISDEKQEAASWPEAGEDGGEETDERRETGELQVPHQQIPDFPSLAPNLQPLVPDPLPIILDDSSSSPLSTRPFYTTHPFLFSNVFALFVMAIGILGAWIYQIDIPQQIAHSPRPAPSSIDRKLEGPKNGIEFVGRVTGMIDVRWADLQTSTIVRANVPLGRKYALASGLMEITYDSGATVILQGPCTYQVDSRDGGYLAIGKLTAKLEKKPSAISGQLSEKTASGQQSVTSSQWSVAGKEGSGFRVQDTNHKSEIINHKFPAPASIFAVRTPTATVTDLGTEFTVHVKPDQSSEIYVIRGSVETARDSRTGGKAFRERLVAGEGICFAAIDETPRRMTAGSVRVRSVPSADASVRDVRKARAAQCILSPSALVATAYQNIWSANGTLLGNNDRKLAFAMVTDGQFGRGENKTSPRSSFDTFRATGSNGQGSEIKNQQIAAPSTCFVGLLYDKKTRFDRIKVFLAAQTSRGGSWAEMPRLFILKNPVDTNQIPPEEDPDDWREVAHQSLYGAFSLQAAPGPGAVFEIALTALPDEERTGYGWALGGVRGNGSGGFISVTELRAYNTPDSADDRQINQ